MKVFTMLSGGVDSSVAAARLVDCGFDVTGIYMRNWSPDNISSPKVQEMLKSCNSDQDEVYAKATADHLNIPFRVINFEKEYWNKIIEPFFGGIARGDMPNPDIWCNQYIKYGVFLDWAIHSGAQYVASGHYARLNVKSKVKSQKSKLQFKTQNQEMQLLRGIDESKDQSYFLAQVPKEKLQYALFPIGHLYKTQVREEALLRGLPTASKPDSQGICFVGKVPIKEFLKERFKENNGDVVLRDGTAIGKHTGAYFYTIGERLGVHQNDKLKFKNIFGNNKKPLYVIEKDINKNILVVGEDDGREPLYKKEFSATSWNFFETPKQNVLYDIEIRYHQQPKSRGKITKIRDTITKQISNNNNQMSNKLSRRFNNVGIPIKTSGKIENCALEIQLVEVARAITPGQTVVLSMGDRIIGSGIIQ